MKFGTSPERDAVHDRREQRRQEDGPAGNFEGYGDARQDGIGNALIRREGAAEIALQCVPEPAQILLVDGPVEAVLLVQLGDCRETGILAEHHRRGTSQKTEYAPKQQPGQQNDVWNDQ
jgi:hypothetical protein